MDKVANPVARVTCGECAGCDTKCLLHQGLCRKCFAKYENWGPGGWQERFAPVLKKCRTDKAFAYLLYTRLKNELQKQRFASQFDLKPVLRALESEG